MARKLVRCVDCKFFRFEPKEFSNHSYLCIATAHGTVSRDPVSGQCDRVYRGTVNCGERNEDSGCKHFVSTWLGERLRRRLYHALLV